MAPSRGKTARFHGNQQQHHNDHHNEVLNKAELAKATAAEKGIFSWKKQGKYLKKTSIFWGKALGMGGGGVCPGGYRVVLAAVVKFIK